VTTEITKPTTALVTAEPLDVTAHERAVEHRAAGAVVSFAGVVRDHDGGRGVVELEYEGHPSAGAVLAEIAAEIAADPAVHALAVSHRVGRLEIGDVALVAAVSTAHRAEGSRCARDWSTRSRRGCRCGSARSSSTPKRNGSTALSLGAGVRRLLPGLAAQCVLFNVGRCPRGTP